MYPPGDVLIMEGVERYRALQRCDLCLWTGRGRQVINRAMRERLIPNGFVVSLGRNSAWDQRAYALGPKGREWVAEKRGVPAHALPFAQKVPDVDSIFFRHLLLTNRIVMAFDLATREGAHPHLNLHQFIPEWEMTDPRAKDRTKQYALWESLSDPLDTGRSKKHSHRPDGLLILHHHDDDPNRSVATYIEADRSTEDSRQLMAKFTAYRIWHQTGGYRRHGVAMRVLFVIEASSFHRIKMIQKLLQAMARELGDPDGSGSSAAFVGDFRFTRADLLSRETAIDTPIWWRWNSSKPVAFFNPLVRKRQKTPPP